MNEKLLFETLYWLVNHTQVGIAEADTKIIMLDQLGLEIVKLNPTEETLQKKTKDALEKKE
ncbi:hypothetical protein LCGC14_1881990 [marine sediment metagenome]|uniref:Uncharacterized protein n=1 Tax=marine sediment metagenome TaxID=412755 RepID=A0A0F9IFX2_9ZZZZ